MRCPKCHYLSFEPEARCRNCGHSLEFEDADPTGPAAAIEQPVDLSLQPPAPHEPARLRDAGAVTPVVSDRGGGPFDDMGAATPPAAIPPDSPRLHRPAPVPPPAARRKEAPPRTVATPQTTELPLFMKGLSVPETDNDLLDAPLVKLPAEPRTPLAVRMSAPDSIAGRARPTHHEPPRKLGTLDRDLLDDLQRLERFEQRHSTGAAVADPHGAADDDLPEPVTRLTAAAIDAALLAVVLAGVLWVTLRWCDLPLAAATILPVLPTSAFLALIVVGYLLLFTAAGGQTIGKMLMHLRVVNDADGGVGDAVSVGQAFYRACAAVPSVIVLGAGFLPGLVGERRAVHDRLAGTRVVRA